ncbi:MAG: hypothetical protein KGZ59_08805 [Chitinophagaceae bacterium]|nr:hypothetical protein [Chitinophagaceae bacterium]
METNSKMNWMEVFQRIRHIVMALLFLAMGVLMIIAEKLNIEALLNFDEIFRWFFGGICFLYGAFRLYRGVQKN